MAIYNCSDSIDNAYGSGSFGACTGQTVGAPNTGVFDQAISGASLSLLLPIGVAVVLVVAATALRRGTRRR